jgi:hypothetical protein
LLGRNVHAYNTLQKFHSTADPTHRKKNTTPFLITMENYPGEGENYLPHLICKNISPSWSTINVVAPPGKNLQQDYLVQINLASY